LMGVTWRQVETKADAELYLRTLRTNQPQYGEIDHVAEDAELTLHLAGMPDDWLYQIGDDADRKEVACFRVAQDAGFELPTIEQYGVQGPNWLTAFGRHVSSVWERMRELRICPYDLDPIELEVGPDSKRAAGRLLATELEKLTDGDVVIEKRPDSTATVKRYRMVARIVGGPR